MSAAFSLRWVDDGAGHRDIVVTVGAYRHRCDLYYFAFDTGTPGDSASDGHLRAVLAALLREWLAAVTALADGDAVFLPLDLWDEGTAWLRVERLDEVVEIRPGLSAIHGYSFSPSAYAGVVPHDFVAMGGVAAIELTVDECLAAIRHSLDAFTSAG